MPKPAADSVFATLTEVRQRSEADHAEEKELWRTFSRVVRDGREEHGWSLEEMAKKLGIGRSMLSYLETGGREWTMKLAKKAVNALANGGA